jgi:signal transduction histidine kinase
MTAPDLIWFSAFMAFPVVGVFLIRRRPRLVIGWIYVGVGAAQLGAGLLDAVAQRASGRGAETTADWASLLSILCFGAAFSLATTFALLCFPLEAHDSRLRRALLHMSQVGLAVVLAGYAFSDEPLDELGRLSPVAFLGSWARILADVVVYLLLVLTMVALGRLVGIWRSSRGEARLRLQWLGLGAAVSLIVVLVGTALAPFAPNWLGAVSEASMVATLPVATGIGVLRSGLFDVERALNRTLVYASLTTIVVLTYFASITVATQFLGDDASQGASLLASAAVAIALAPVKERLQKLVDQLVYGDRADSVQVLKVQVAQLAEDLQESRERIVRAREEERLRVRRDLHDGLGPTLAAAGLQVDALRERWRTDDPVIAELLAKVKSELSTSVRDVRRIVDGLRPPSLDDLGLLGVVKRYADGVTAAGLVVDVHCPSDLQLPGAATEVAAYRIVTEALTNVVRHARASTCRVTIDQTDGWLLLTVADDGVGIWSSHAGVGTTSMLERATELGGRLTISSPDAGGTVVSARLPWT